MIKVKIFTVGKTKERWLQEAIDAYLKRLSSQMTVEWAYAKNDTQLLSFLKKESSYICLDPKGTAFSSEAFSKWLTQRGSRLTFVIGGAQGLERAVLSEASALISLSPLTFTHQLARLILVEQLYRACEIEKGSSYHK
jgi:23S rRNA (pseudouridine1915-N3)-methyltransferase